MEISLEEKEAIEEFKREYNDGIILKSDIIIELNTARIVIDLIDKLQKENFNYRVANKLLEDEAYKDGFEERKKLQKENAELKEELDYYKQKENQDFDERDYYEE